MSINLNKKQSIEELTGGKIVKKLSEKPKRTRGRKKSIEIVPSDTEVAEEHR